ncbi:MAG: class I SAM-dependent methyltransferase [Egibacteraceae bacterium]
MDDSTPAARAQAQERARALWSTGDYARIAERLEPVAAELVGALGDIGAARLLDVAAGTGNVAVAAAEQGAQVTATDLTPSMVALGSTRTEAARLPVVWQEADAADLPFDDAAVDVATSCLGVMFAPEPAAVIAELARVLRPGGLLAVVAWVPHPTAERLTKAFLRHQPPPPPGAADPRDWGRPEVVEGWLSGAFTDVACAERAFSWDFATPAEATEYFLTASPWHVASLSALPPTQQAVVHSETRAAIAELATADGRVSMPSPYLLVTAARR